MSEDTLQITGKIYPLPALPIRLREAANDGRLIVFIGAGASSVIGCLRWEELALRLTEVSFEKRIINYWEKEKLKGNDARKIISIVKNQLDPNDYNKTLENSLKADPELIKKYPIYEQLVKLRSIYITTNIDICFDHFFEQSRILTKSRQFVGDGLKQNVLIKLHGTIRDQKTIVFTTQDYIKHYNLPEVRDFLKLVFGRDYSVLFVGYSMAELEILDYVLMKADFQEEPKYTEAKHYLLLPFYKSEEGLFKFEQSYFSSLGVVTIPYGIDENGYEQLYFVIEKWEKEINVSTSYLYKSYRFIEENVDDYVEANVSEILQLIRNDDHFRSHFFQNLKTIKWFDTLKDNGYFFADKAPAPQSTDKEGFFAIPQWNILPYLEKVSQQVSDPSNEKYIKELLEIISTVSTFKDPSGGHIDNYRTWWFFVKILINLPADKIPVRVIDLIPIWLNSKFDASLPGADILNKLLPKFLEGSPTADNIIKAERIIRYVTELKLVKEGRKRKTLKEKYEFPIEYYWLEKALEKYGQPIGEKCSKRVIDDLCLKIRKVLKKKESKSLFSVENRDYLLTLQEKDEGSYFLKVFDIGKRDNDKSYEIYFEDTSTVKKLKRKVLAKYTIDFENVSQYVQRAHTILKKNPLFLSYNGGELERDLFHLYTNLYSGETYHSLYHSGYRGENARSLLTVAFKHILLGKARKDSKSTNQILKGFFKDKYLYFPKMALYIIGNTENAYMERFWELLKSENDKMILDSSSCEDELRHVLQNAAANLSEEQERMIETVIESGPMYVTGQDKDLQIIIWKQKRYAALATNQRFKNLNEKMREITGEDIQLRPAVGEVTTWVGPGPSALLADQILEMTNSKLARYLADFKESDPWRGPTARGLAETLKQVATDHPEKFTDDFHPFLNTAYLYVDYILWGIRDAWGKKNIVDWARLFGFLLEYIDRSDFWQDKLLIASERGWSPNHESVSGMIAELIQEGVRDDAWAFSETHFEGAKRILQALTNGLGYPPASEGEYSDYVTHALNSNWGKVISALLLFMLRTVRIDERKRDKKEDKRNVKWDVVFRNQYDDLLNKGIVEAYTWFGHYLPQLHYVDKEWANAKVDDTYSRKGTKSWEAFINGYLYGGRVYQNIYVLMRPHYEYGIGYSFKETHDRERLIQHVCMAYLNGYESFEGTESLFHKILDNWKYEQIREIVNYFWMQRGSVIENVKYAEENRQRIIHFWKWVYEKYANKAPEVLEKEDKLLLSDIAKLTVFLNEIHEDNLKWLMLSAPYVQEHFNAPFFIEYLDELKAKGDRNTTADRIGQIYLEMLNHMTPDFDEVHIRSIVEFLYQAGAREKADRICIIYGSRGNNFLRDIYEKYAAA